MAVLKVGSVYFWFLFLLRCFGVYIFALAMFLCIVMLTVALVHIIVIPGSATTSTRIWCSYIFASHRKGVIF